MRNQKFDCLHHERNQEGEQEGEEKENEEGRLLHVLKEKSIWRAENILLALSFRPNNNLDLYPDVCAEEFVWSKYYS